MSVRAGKTAKSLVRGSRIGLFRHYLGADRWSIIIQLGRGFKARFRGSTTVALLLRTKSSTEADVAPSRILIRDFW